MIVGGVRRRSSGHSPVAQEFYDRAAARVRDLVEGRHKGSRALPSVMVCQRCSERITMSTVWYFHGMRLCRECRDDLAAAPSTAQENPQ